MKEILDRRLRITERMLYQVSSKVAGPLVPDSAHPHGPWIDGVRVRMFEYPFLGASNAARIGAGNIASHEPRADLSTVRRRRVDDARQTGRRRAGDRS